MTRGRKPIPTAKLKASGGFRNDRHGDRADEPQVKSERPSCPRHLSKEARKEWGRICKLLIAAGIITKLDRTILAVYCEAYAKWVDAKKHIADEGTFIYLEPKDADEDDGDGQKGYPIQNPYVSIYNKAIEQMSKIGASLGLDPTSRTKIKVDKPKEVDNAKLKYFKMQG